MPPLRVLLTHDFSEPLLDELRAVSARLVLTVHPTRRAEELPPDAVAGAEVLYTSTALPQPEAAPELKWVQCHSAGIDHLADHPLLKTAIQVTTVSGIHGSQMAEYVLLMMLAAGHHLQRLLEYQRRREWPPARAELLTPHELRGATLGIVGFGSIGREVARLAHAFGMDILATKRDAMHPADPGYILPGAGDRAGDLLKRLYPPQALRSMLAESDYVLTAVPLASETRHLIGALEFQAMKKSAVFINVARGGVVDETALVAALRAGEIGGAALDVFAAEPLPADSPLWELPNVILTPHISGLSRHYDQRAASLFAENLRRYIAGEELLNIYDRTRGY